MADPLTRLGRVLRDDLDQRQRSALASWVAFTCTFAAVRGITWSIRAGRGPFGNISAGGEHLHHYLWGIGMLTGVGAVAVRGTDEQRAHPAVAISYGSGLALIVDEFALLLDLKDVYWAQQGRISVDLGVGCIAVTGSYFACAAGNSRAAPGPPRTEGQRQRAVGSPRQVSSPGEIGYARPCNWLLPQRPVRVRCDHLAMQDDTMTWAEVSGRLAPARTYWLCTTTPSGAPHAAPVWGVVTGGTLYLYSERSTVKARNLAADPRVVVHLESGEDVVIMRGVAEDAGAPSQVPSVVAALAAKYSGPEDRQYLPDADPGFDVIYAIMPQSAMAWRLEDYAASQRRWFS